MYLYNVTFCFINMYDMYFFVCCFVVLQYIATYFGGGIIIFLLFYIHTCVIFNKCIQTLTIKQYFLQTNMYIINVSRVLSCVTKSLSSTSSEKIVSAFCLRTAVVYATSYSNKYLLILTLDT